MPADCAPEGAHAAVLEEIWFSAEARSARSARHAVRRCLAATDLRAVEEIELLAGELFAAAAATAQGRGRICVRVRRTRDRVRVEVAHEPTVDAAPVAVRDPIGAAILERLLDAFAARWGRTVGGSGDNATWFELAVEDRSSVQLPLSVSSR
ncbi:MAG: hypothetical protein ACXV4A_11950 [Actinomycetes bacterium]